MNKFLRTAIIMVFVFVYIGSFSQCTIDTTNTTTGFTPSTPAVIQPGIAYSQTTQVFVPTTYNVYTVDSLHIDSLTGLPSGITYVFNPPSGTVLGGKGGAICFSGTTNDTVGPYPLTFYGAVHTNAGLIPFSYLVTVAPTFGYKFRVETQPVAIFSVDSPVCTAADSVRFVDHTGGYPTRWNWIFSGGSPATSTHQFPAVAYDSAGTYLITLIARNGIGSDTITQSITVNPSVVATVSTTPALDASSATGTAMVMASAGTPPFVYLWSNGATTDSLTNVVHGTYSISVTDTKGCRYANDTVNISFANGIMEACTGQNIKVYPNPATDVLNLQWSQKTNADVVIIDLNGNVVRSFTSNGNGNACDIHRLAAGDYLIRLTDNTSHTQQLMKFSKL